MLASNLIVDPLAEQDKPLKIHALSSIFQDIETGLKFSGYCYYCEICEEMLALCPNLIDPLDMRMAFHDKCPSCHWKLESSLRCVGINVPSRNLFQFHPMYKDPSSINSSVKAHEILLTPYLLERDDPSKIDLEPLSEDLIEDPLENFLGRFVVVYGDRTAHELSERLCLKAQMSNSHGGLNSKVIFIDGGNIFDPYLISRYADQYGIRREKALEGIQIGRAFTCYQLTYLIMKILPEALERYKAKLAIVSDITKLYTDSDIEEREAFDTFNKISAFLAKLAEKKSATVLVTCVTASKHGWLESILHSRAHITFQNYEQSKSVWKDVDLYRMMNING
jgi:hypothetical protein